MMSKKSYDKIHYKKTYLKEVILRVDFQSPISEFGEKLPSKLSKAILENFPVLEPQTLPIQEIQVTSSGLEASTRQEKQWAYFGLKREKSLVVGRNYFYITTQAYESFEKLCEEFFPVMEQIANIEPEIIIGRLGLRYVNLIELEKGNPLDWKGYIHPNLLGLIEFTESKKNLTRAFNIVEYAFDDLSLKCQLGMANSDYPATIRKRQYVLDLDAYSVAGMETKELRKKIGLAHDCVQDFFERAILDGVRKELKK